MTTKVILVVLGFACLFHAAVGKSEEVACEIDGKDVEYGFWNGLRPTAIKDSHGKGQIATFKTSGVKGITAHSNWLTFEYNKDTITVSTTDSFKDYEETEVGTSIAVDIDVQCENGQSHKIPFSQKIIDANTYEPEWSQKEYIFTMHGSLQKYNNLANLMEISITDMDCSPDSLYLSLSNDQNEKPREFDLSKGEREGKKTSVNLYVNEIIHPPFEHTYTMRVKDRDTDDGKESKVKLSIKLLESTAPFEFTESSYSFEVLEGTKLVADNPGGIQLSDGIDSDVEVLIEESEYSKFFKVDVDLVSGKIKLRLAESLPTLDETVYAANQDFTLKLKAKWQNKEATTDVKIHSDKNLEYMCHVPGFDINNSRFSNPKKMDDTHTGTIFDISGIKNVEGMSCTGTDYLKCDFDKTKGDFKITPTEKFKTYEDIEKDTEIQMDLTIQCPYDTNKTIVFIQRINDINNKEPTFTEDKYTFSLYNEIEKGFQMTGMHSIIVTEKDLTTSYCYFKLEGADNLLSISSSVNRQNKECRPILSLKQKLIPPFDQTFTLTVEDSGSPKQSSKTTVRVLVTKDSTNEPKFTEKNYYTQMHPKGPNFTTLQGYAVLQLENGIDEDTKIVIADEEYVNKFRLKINKLTNDIQVQLVENVTLCHDCESVSFKIKALWRGLESETTLTIRLKEDETTTLKTTEPTQPTGGTRPTTSYPFDVNGDELAGFSSFILGSFVTIIMIIIVGIMVITALIMMLLKRFLLASPQTLPI